MRSKNKGSIFLVVIWILFILISGNFGIVSRLFSTSETQNQIVEDWNMTTRDYHTEIQIQEDHSYLVKEQIAVYFDNYRHGIYRYIPQKGMITELLGKTVLWRRFLIMRNLMRSDRITLLM